MKSAALFILAAVVVVAQATFPGYQELVEKKTGLKYLGCWPSAVQEIIDNTRQYLASCYDHGNEEAGLPSIPLCLITNLPELLGSVVVAASECMFGPTRTAQ